MRLSSSVTVVNSESDSDSVSEMDIVEHVLEIMLRVSDLSGPSGNPARKSLQCLDNNNQNILIVMFIMNLLRHRNIISFNLDTLG